MYYKSGKPQNDIQIGDLKMYNKSSKPQIDM